MFRGIVGGSPVRAHVTKSGQGKPGHSGQGRHFATEGRLVGKMVEPQLAAVSAEQILVSDVFSAGSLTEDRSDMGELLGAVHRRIELVQPAVIDAADGVAMAGEVQGHGSGDALFGHERCSIVALIRER